MKTHLLTGESLIFNGNRMDDVHSYDPDTREVTYYERHWRTAEKIPDALDPTGCRTLTETARTLEILKPERPADPSTGTYPVNPFDPYDPVYMGCLEQRALHQLRWAFINRLGQFKTELYSKETAEKTARWAADLLRSCGLEHYRVRTRLIDHMDWARGTRSYHLGLRAYVPKVPRMVLYVRLQKPEIVDPALHDWKCTVSAGAFEGLDREPIIVPFASIMAIVPTLE